MWREKHESLIASRIRTVQHVGPTGRHDFTAAEPCPLFGSRNSFDEAASGDRMDAETIDNQFSLRMSQSLYEDLHRHLFPGDGDEHGAVIEAGLAVLNRRRVLLARRLWKAQDGVDWVPGHVATGCSRQRT
jgi:hypothetical protein